MEKAIIYGAGQTGKHAYECFRNIYDCLFLLTEIGNYGAKLIVMARKFLNRIF